MSVYVEVHLVPREKTGHYRAEARDTPIVDQHGESRISVGDYAAAVIDILENGSFVRARPPRTDPAMAAPGGITGQRLGRLPALGPAQVFAPRDARSLR